MAIHLKIYSNKLFISPLKLIRVAKDCTIDDMGKAMGISKAYLSAIEVGKRNVNKNFEKYLEKIDLTWEDYCTIEKYSQKILKKDIPDDIKYAKALIKTLEVVYPKLKGKK